MDSAGNSGRQDSPEYTSPIDPTAADFGPSASAPTQSFTPQQAAVQITRDGYSWRSTLGQALTVTYAFRDTAPGTMPDDTGGFSQFNSAQITQVLNALQAWSDVANITFNRVLGAGGYAYSNSASILFGNYATGAANAAAFAYLPSPGATGSNNGAGDVWVNSTLSYNASPTVGNYGGQVLIHEIGHALGLEHPADYDAGATSPTYGTDAIYVEDSRQYTVMSYFSEANTGASFGGRYSAVPLLHDIYAIQRLYGAATSTALGDTIYGFNSTANRPWFSATSDSTKLVFAVWDNGGIDTFDFSGYSANQQIDLRPDAFSNVGGLTGNVAIPAGVTIENAKGGGGADFIFGNTARNVLTGNAGDDYLMGGGGADSLFGGAGADTFAYASASDSTPNAYDFIQDFQAIDLIDVTGLSATGLSVVRTNGGSVIFANTPTGAFQLAVVGEALQGGRIAANGLGFDFVGLAGSDTLLGSANADRLFGQGGNDLLNGGAGDDQIVGGAGADSLYGGAGADTFVFYTAADSNAAGYDYIQDFQSGADVVDLNSLGAQGISVVRAAGGSLVFASTSSGNFQLAVVGDALQGSDLRTGSVGIDLIGTEAADTLRGTSLNDRIYGNGGADVLQGNGGADQLYGGQGADTFKFLAATDSTPAAFDIIFDFQSGVDKIDLRGTGLVNVGIALIVDAYFVFANGPGVANFQLGVRGLVTTADILTGSAVAAIAAVSDWPASASHDADAPQIDTAFEAPGYHLADQGAGWLIV